ncbi:hypothetical protein ACLOJK_028617 [Asimina triloba]
MAEVLLSPLLDLIYRNLSSSAVQELQLGWDVDEELQKLKSTLSAIQSVLEDAEEKQFHSNAIQDWLQKLKYVAYDAEDLVDEIVTEAQQSKATESGNEEAARKKKRKWQVWGFFPSLFNSSQRGMASRIREINAKLEQIAKERNFHLETRHGGKQLVIIRPPVSSVRDESSEVLGRDNDREQITSFLLSDDSDKRKFSVIAIVGMGGVGKTTLAQVVYNDRRVTENFELRAWVCVSEDFDVKRLTKEIITSISKNSCDLSDIDSLQCSLRDELDGKKFLLVLDDVWSENDSDWERLRAPFTFGAKGSKIVVTTRSEAVSNAMQAATTHNLKCLSEKDCWSVFVNQAFNDGNANAYPELLKIGEELVNKCGGLPLAAKALGGLLSSKRQAKEWENILKSPMWSWRGPASNILPALRLSYQYLPAHLKRCFTFCSVFPKDYEFEEKQLILLWVAHGFIRSEEEKQIEDTASEYFNDLLLRSFFQLSVGRYYKMHDLVHDLAQFMSSDECVQMEHGKSRGVRGKTQHLSYSVSEGELINFESFYESKGLRTFLLMNNTFEVVVDGLRLRSIRVLDLSWSKITELPNPIGNLRHLRYLNLSGTRIKELPESIDRIYNLQTLLLRSCRYLVRLPNEMRKLTNMRHLDLEWCDEIESMPPQIGRLTFLQTLPWFVVGREREIGVAELKELTDLRGKLVIKKLENVTEAVDAELANLTNKPFINHLSLEWSTDRDWSTQDGLDEEVVEGLQPHPSLKILKLDGYMGTHFPSWMMKMDKCLSNLTALYLWNRGRCSILSNLSNLTRLKIFDCEGLNELPPLLPSLSELTLGGVVSERLLNSVSCLTSLSRLTIQYMSSLTSMPRGMLQALTQLESLTIRGCNRLVTLEDEVLPSTLKRLVFSYCSNLKSLPRKGLPSSLERLEISECPVLRERCLKDIGEDWPKISHIPDVQLAPTKAADLTSYGVVVNGFSELENEYVGYCGKALWNKKVWTIGPVSLCNKDMLVKAARGNRAAISQHECLIWLDLRKPKSVVYVSFGSLCRLGPSQLMQIGLALEASKKPFIWVIRGVVEPKEIEKWIAVGFEDRTKETGLIIRGWAPQILILSHPAIGGFSTHCGWNSTMESICAGVPMIIWPLFGEQVLNEKLVVNVLKIGVDLGILRHAMWWNPVEKFDVLVTMEEISKAVERAATLALACLRTDPQSRPTMWNVSHRLSVSRAPIQRASHSITFGHLLDVQAGSVITVSLYQK